MQVFKKLIQNLIRIIQRVLIFVTLTLVYFLGFGITLLFAMIFNRRALRGYTGKDNTFWVEAEGYEADIEDAFRQS